MPTPSTAEPAAKPAPLCPGCGGKIEGRGRGTGKTFCTESCRASFKNRMRCEGVALAPLVKASFMGRHAKPGSREAEICRFARRQLAQIAGELNDADAANGRPDALAYVETLMHSGFTWLDRRRG